MDGLCNAAPLLEKAIQVYAQLTVSRHYNHRLGTQTFYNISSFKNK